MTSLARPLLSVAAGLIFGVFTALFAAGVFFPSISSPGTKVEVGLWSGDWTTGSSDASARHRAWVAVNGVLAMTSEEAVYLIASTDSEGEPLREACRYELSGDDQDAFWWSITLYDASGYLPLNDGAALSVDASQMGSGPWRAEIAGAAPEDGSPWISSENAGSFNLLLRLYRPSPQLLQRPERIIRPPQIERLECGV